ncbi:MAG: DNA repair protein RecN [Acidiferrobacterales bacterium]
MLSHLYIRDFTIVPRLELSFDGGFTVLTGETGAGKSILIDALIFALGARAEATSIRHGCERAEVIASFDLHPQEDAAAWLEQHDLFADGECVVRRLVDANQPSRGSINGRPVPMQMLRELGERLVDIHGQHEHQSLLRRDGQRQLLDDYANLATSVKELSQHHHTLGSLISRLETLQRQSADRSARVDLLRYQVQELEELGLQIDEIQQLEEERTRLANGAELLDGVKAIAHSLYDDEERSVSLMLAHAINSLEQLSRYDTNLHQLTNLLNDASVQIDEVASQLHRYQDTLDLDPQRLQWIDQRLVSMHDLARKHHVRLEELPGVLEQLRTELDDLEDFDLNLTKLNESVGTARATYMTLAEHTSKKRKVAARELSKAVTEQMQNLGMTGGCFEVHLESLPDGSISAVGLERVQFLVSANAGQPPRPLTKVASGGELSRISLGLQVVVAGVGRIPSLIFDEVDVGIGGRIAEIVGQQLRTLGEARQVLCITHLAQVAALGNHHLCVSKTNQNAASLTQVTQLSADARIEEIARMIGGIEISEQTMAHAQDMLARAQGVDCVSA